MIEIKNRLKLLFVLLIFTSSAWAQDDSQPKYNSLLWKITGQGMDQPSYLYGTMHVSQKLAFHLGDPFFEALESTDMVALELNPNKWMKDLSESDLLDEAYSLYANYGSNFYADAFKFPLPKNRDFATQLANNDNLINGLLYRSNTYTQEFEEETYLDLYIFQTSRRMGKDVFSLEKYQEVMEFSRKAMIPDSEEEKPNYRKTRDLFKDGSPQELLQDAYRKGDLNMVDSISNLMNPSLNYQKYMLWERNKIMAANMDSIIQSGTSLFTGVGAAHLPGEHGVIELMRSKGYTLTSINKGSGGKSKKYEKKYDNIIVPFTFSNQAIENSFYSLDAPGKMYSMPVFGNVISYIHPDMANGAYYWVKRIKTYAPLQGHSLDYTLQRIDSLLYENIPGEITQKQTINIGGYPGIDLINKTRQGDYQHYQIVVTPLEALIFKVGGKKEFVLDHCSPYFDNIQLSLPSGKNILKTSPPEGGFSVDLPDYQVLYRLKSSAQSGGPGLEYQALDAQGNYFLARKTVLNDLKYIEENEFELKQFVKQFIEDDRYDTLFTRLGTYDKHPCLDVTYTIKDLDKKLHARIIIQGANYYQLSQLTNQSFDQCLPFFNSLKFEPIFYAEDFEELIDTTLRFSAHTIKISKEAEMVRQSQMIFKNFSDKKKKNDYKFKNAYRQLLSTNTGEEIGITMERFNVFTYYPNIDSLWASEIRYWKKDNKFDIIRRSQAKEDSLYTMSLTVVDPHSSQGMMVKQVLNKHTLYTLQTEIDTLLEPSEFVKETYRSFEILPDTIQQRSIFAANNKIFFDFITSSDSAKIAHAFDYMGKINFEKSDEQQLLNLLNHFNFKDQGIQERADLMLQLSAIDTKNTRAFLQDEYLKNEDTTTYQIAALSALAGMKTVESIKTLKNLLVNNPTIPSSDSDLDNFYDYLTDSLAISKLVFPDFIELSVFPEYKQNNLYLLSSAVYYHHLKNKGIKKYKRQLINEALIELKRQFAKEEGKNERDNYSYFRSQENSTLINYGIIIAPWYKKEEKVKKFFREIERLEDKKTVTNILCNMEYAGIPVKQETWNTLLQEKSVRSYALNQLILNQMEYHFPTEIKTQENIALSNILDAYNFENDSTDLVFIDKFLIESKESSGYYYFYRGKTKSKYTEEITWNIYYTGPQPINGEEVDVENRTVKKSEKIDPKENNEDLMDEIKEKLEMQGRERVKTGIIRSFLGNGIF